MKLQILVLEILCSFINGPLMHRVFLCAEFDNCFLPLLRVGTLNVLTVLDFVINCRKEVSYRFQIALLESVYTCVLLDYAHHLVRILR